MNYVWGHKAALGKEKSCVIKLLMPFGALGVVLMWAVTLDRLTSKPGTPRGPGKPLAPSFPWMVKKKKQSNES